MSAFFVSILGSVEEVRCSISNPTHIQNLSNQIQKETKTERYILDQLISFVNETYICKYLPSLYVCKFE